jgi:L-ascorbate metabolism protein UlaG (beta-lactamase superfamily)
VFIRVHLWFLIRPNVENRIHIDVTPASPGLDAPGPGRLNLRWLGQAGFWIRGESVSVVIDPYLSDALAAKYRGREVGHERMMTPPIPAGRISADWVFCTHRHGDHMDKPTLIDLAAANPRARFVGPVAEREHALTLDLPADRWTFAAVDQRIELGPAPAAWACAIPSAHETIRLDSAGQPFCVGFVIELAGLRVYHSGDCVPYPGLADRLAELKVDIALLPANGRRPELTAKGILGNFFAAEAVELCRQANIPTLFLHHWGLFAANTADPADLAAIARNNPDLAVIVPDPSRQYGFSRDEKA